MQIFLFDSQMQSLKILQNPQKILLKKSEILLFLASKEILPLYHPYALSLEDKQRILLHSNLKSNIHFQISRTLKKLAKNFLSYPIKKYYTCISHSFYFAILGVSRMPFGIDLEKIQPRDFTAHLNFCFNQKEKELLRNSPNPLLTFYTIWTTKESQIKLFNLDFSALKQVGLSAHNCKTHTYTLSFLHSSFVFSLSIFNKNSKFYPPYS